MTVWKMLFWFLCALVAMVLLCLGTMYLEKKAPRNDYDERQKQVRGNAYRLSFALGISYQLVLFALTDFQKELPLKLSTMIYLGVLVQLLVCHIYCLLNHAALPLSEKAWLGIGTYLLTGFGQLASFYSNMNLYQRVGLQLGYTPPWEGIWLKLALAVTSFALAIMHLIALVWKERE